MSDYLSHMAARSLNLTTVVQPRLASLFEPLPNSIYSSDLHSELVETSEIGRIAESAEPASSTTTVPSPNVALPPSPPLPNVASATSLPSPSPPSKLTPSVVTPIPSKPSPPATEALTPTMAASNSSSPSTEVPQFHQEPVESTSLIQPQASITHLSATQSPPPTISPSEPKTSLEPRSPVPIRPVIQPHITPLPEQPISPPPVKRPSPPTIQVSIGRIDVRAITTPTPSRQSPTPRQPKLSLEDYLRSKSSGGSRRGGSP